MTATIVSLPHPAIAVRRLSGELPRRLVGTQEP
jgi:hypothetical protein